MSQHGDEYSYDAVPYLVRSYPQSHPDRMATLAILFGMQPPPVTGCRVLELGCASGSNLIPMAEGLPDSQFVGVDLSSRQIAAGQAMVDALGLKNIVLKPLNISEINGEFGLFDYIIAHGIYSWVPETAQEQILAICKHNLSPNGVAYVSYNANPGWRMLGIIRDMLLYHTRGIEDPSLRAAHGRALLDFLSDAATDHDAVAAPVARAVSHFKDRLGYLGREGDAYLLHELMEEVNTPLYFSQFVERAARYGLQYLSEAELSDVMPHRFPQPVVDAIGTMSSNLIEMEQYLDFLRNVTFRQNLLCHEDIAVDRTFSPERLMGLHVASRAKPVSDAPDLHSPAVERFQSSDRTSLGTEHPASKAALLHLSRVWPRTVPCAELLDGAYTLLGTEDVQQDPTQDTYLLNSNLLRAYSYNSELVALHTYAPEVAAGITDYPAARPVARWQAHAGSAVTNQYHEVVDLDPVSRLVLPLLDGSRNRTGLRKELAALVAQGTLGMQGEGTGIGDARSIEGVLEEEVSRILAFLADSALLIPS